jgi:hypothetical protein
MAAFMVEPSEDQRLVPQTLYDASSREQRAALLRMIFDRLQSAGRFDPSACLHSTWEALEHEANKRFRV